MRSLSCLVAIALLTFGPLARANDIAVAALGQVGVTVYYDPSYRQLAFPNGDVPHLMTYFARQKYARTISTDARDYVAGDIVAWDLGGGTLHVDCRYRTWIIGLCAQANATCRRSLRKVQ